MARESNYCSIILVVREQNNRGSHQGKIFISKLEVRPVWEKCLQHFGVCGKSKNKKNKHSQKSNQKNCVKNYHKSYQHIVLDPESSEEEEDTDGNQAVSEDLQRTVLNCYEYMCASKGQKHATVVETCTALQLHRGTVGKL